MGNKWDDLLEQGYELTRRKGVEMKFSDDYSKEWLEGPRLWVWFEKFLEFLMDVEHVVTGGAFRNWRSRRENKKYLSTFNVGDQICGCDGKHHEINHFVDYNKDGIPDDVVCTDGTKFALGNCASHVEKDEHDRWICHDQDWNDLWPHFTDEEVADVSEGRLDRIALYTRTRARISQEKS